MNRLAIRQIQVCLVVLCAILLTGCGVTEGIHIARDPGKSTSRFRYEFEMIPNAVVMREDTEPRWQLGRYVFVRGADRVLVISRITSWSETATREQRKSGDIPDMKDEILERLWITIPQGTAVGEELDMHALSYRFMVNYDRGNVGDAQFARPFRALGNVRILSEDKGSVDVRLRLRLTTDGATAWEVFEKDLKVPMIPEGRYAKQAKPDAVIYSLSRPGEVPSTGMTPVKVTPEMASAKVDPSDIVAAPAPDSATPTPATDDAKDAKDGQTPAPLPAGQDQTPAKPDDANGAKANGAKDNGAKAEPAAVKVDVKPGEMEGKWYSRSPSWEVYLQLKDDGSFIHSASRPNAVPVLIKGDWRLRSGYLVLHIRSFMVGKSNQMSLRKDNPYAMLKLAWQDANTVVMDGDMPAPGATVGGFTMHRAKYPDLSFIPAMSYIPGSPKPAFVGQPTAVTQPAAAAHDAPADASKDKAKPKSTEDPFKTFNPDAN